MAKKIWNAGGGWGCGGQADELRLSTTARSAAWVLASYKTQGDNANFTGFGAVNTVVSPNTLIDAGASWMYHNTGALPGAGWYNSSFSEAGWSNGVAPLGYPTAKPVTTTLSFGPDGTNKWAAYYFRKSFTIANAAAVTGLVASFKADDGAVLYLNGTKIHTSTNIIEPVANNTLCTAAANEP